VCGLSRERAEEYREVGNSGALVGAVVEHRIWVRDRAAHLRGDGVRVVEQEHDAGAVRAGLAALPRAVGQFEVLPLVVTDRDDPGLDVRRHRDG